MTNAYSSIKNYHGEDWAAFLEEICVYDVFKGLFEEYPEVEVFKSVIKYIVNAYSIDSDMIMIGLDWDKNKKKIFENTQVQQSTELYNALVHLHNDKVREAINLWLEFADNNVFTELQMLKDLKVELQHAAISRIIKSNGEVDYDQKFKNTGYVRELRIKIHELELELIQNNSKLKDGVVELKRILKQKNHFGIENVAV